MFLVVVFLKGENGQNKIKRLMFLSPPARLIVVMFVVLQCVVLRPLVSHSQFKSTKVNSSSSLRRFSRRNRPKVPTMTVGGTVETCEKEGGRGGGEGGNEVAELLQSFTTLSTIAIQAGQSQITISVLKVGGENQ